MAVVLLILLLAAVGGFLGDLLEFALWGIVVLAALGAMMGLVLYRAFQRFKSGVT